MTYQPGVTWRDPPAHILRHAAASTDPAGYLRRWRQRNREIMDAYADRAKPAAHSPVLWSEFQDNGTELRRMSWDGGRTWHPVTRDECNLFAARPEMDAAKTVAVLQSYFPGVLLADPVPTPQARAPETVRRRRRKVRRQTPKMKRVFFLSRGRTGAVSIPIRF